MAAEGGGVTVDRQGRTPRAKQEDGLINSAPGEVSHKTHSGFMHLRAELSV